MTRRNSRRQAAVLVGGTALLAALALPSARADVEEILVTAQKREQSLVDVPISVNVVGGDKVDQFDITTFEELDEYVPNLVISDTPGNNEIYLRGIGTSSGSLALEQSVALFVDGIYAGRARQFQEPFLDVERVEVLRGPQGALVGKNTSAGAINVVTRTPTEEAEVSVSGEYEFENEGYTTTAILSGPLSDRFRGRLVARYEDVGGYVENLTKNRDEPEGDRKLVRGTGVMDLTDTVTATLRVEYAKSDIDGHPFVTIPVGGDFSRKRQADAPEYDKQDTLNSSLTFDVDLGRFALTSITGYTDLDSENFVDADFTAAPLLGASFFDDLKQFSQEVRVLSPAEDRFNYVVGAYYLDRQVDIVRQTFWNLGPFVGTSNRDYAEDSTLYSVYGQAQYRIADAWTLIGSARYTSEDKDADLTRYNDGVVPPSQLATPISDDLSESEVDVSGTVQWQASDSAMVYLTYAEGSKGGGFAGASSSVTAANFGFDGESSTSYELGTKLNLLQGRMFLGVAAFTTKYEDLQTATYNGVSFDFANAAEAKTDGLEVDLVFDVDEHWKLLGSLAFLDAQYEKYPNGACIGPNNVIPGCFEDLSGTDLPFAPDYSGSLDIQYTSSVGRFGLTAALGAAFRGDAYTHSAEFDESLQDSYVKYNLRVELSDPQAGWSLALLGKNLTDEDTISSAFETPVSAPPGATPDYNTVTQQVDVGRTIALQASWHL